MSRQLGRNLRGPRRCGRTSARLKRALAKVRAVEARAAAQETELERYSAIFANSLDGIFLTDPEGNCIAANPAICRMLDRTEEEILQGGRTCVVDFSDPRFAAALEHRSRTGSFQGEVTYKRSDGTPVPVEISTALFKNGSGLDWAVIFVRDLTERRQLERQLLRAQRLEAAGRIAAQVAHDFNNLLTPITAYPELIKSRLAADHPALPFCDAMLEAADQMAALNEDMMALGRRGHVKQQPADINRVVEQALAQMPGPPETLALRLDLTPDPAPVSGSQTQLLRVVMNLVSNARDAMRDTGSLHLRTDNVQMDETFSRERRIAMGEYVRLTVADTGPGIPPEIRERIFDAFFTTKQTSSKVGSGLGLAIVQAIVEDHHGNIELESELGKGTTFSVYLPACRQELEELPKERREGGTEALLVVDDDRLQREAATHLLRALGYRVNAVASGEEAVSYLREHSADLLILDMLMPAGIDGVETYRRVLEVRPGQKAIIVSGFADTDRVQAVRALGARGFLRKPLVMDMLARAVREELDR